jgi:hypothetical protein
MEGWRIGGLAVRGRGERGGMGWCLREDELAVGRMKRGPAAR